MVIDLCKKDRKRGFTMAEALIVVAIIAVLGGVSALAVQRHQRSLALMERNAIAKEIFIAAQNHLTMAEGQGYMTEAETVEFGEDFGENAYEYYILSESGSEFLFQQMLPFGAIDETARTGGRYLIHYRTNPAEILDVCYWTPGGTRYGGDVSESDLTGLFGVGPGQEIDKVLVGWYGGEANAITVGTRLQNPVVSVENAERLLVRVTNPNATGSLKLIITSKDEDGNDKAMAALLLSFSDSDPDWVKGETDNTFTVVLDDITAPNRHFADLIDNLSDIQGEFVPGEDITVKAVAFNNEELTNIAYSNEWTVNSLYADVESESSGSGLSGVGGNTALIGNFRHLENLAADVSGVDLDGLGISQARQIADLLWYDADAEDADDEKSASFTYRIATDNVLTSQGDIDAEEVSVYKLNETTSLMSKKPGFLPVYIQYAGFVYDGKYIEDEETETAMCRSVTGVKVDVDGAAGLFTQGLSDDASGGESETEPYALTVQNLALIDFEITGVGNSGALAGELPDGSSVTNVLAYNTKAFDDEHTTATIVSMDQSAGGLIGCADGVTITKCAAALLVATGESSDDGSAGGLIGQAADSTVTACYSGGHTDEGKYDEEKFNVTSERGCAGGLIGAASGTSVTNCYSTCSACGVTAGGLVGSAESESEITRCYATGLVAGSTAQGAFAGSLDDDAEVEDDLYYSIVNDGMASVGGLEEDEEGPESIAALDADTLSYIDFIETANPTALEWLPKKEASLDAAYADAKGVMHATNYDPTLAKYYPSNGENKTLAVYILRTVAQLDGDLKVNAEPTTDDDALPADFVATHYGDWPAPETFVINTPTGGSGS